MVQLLKALLVPLEDSSVIPSTHIKACLGGAHLCPSGETCRSLGPLDSQSV